MLFNSSCIIQHSSFAFSEVSAAILVSAVAVEFDKTTCAFARRTTILAAFSSGTAARRVLTDFLVLLIILISH